LVSPFVWLAKGLYVYKVSSSFGNIQNTCTTICGMSWGSDFVTSFNPNKYSIL